MQEIVDVVDCNDVVIRQEKKAICHKNKLWHRGAATLIFDSAKMDKMLLQKRSNNKTSNPGKWCITGGHLNAGETYLEGGKRECFEELGELENVTFEKLFKIKKTADSDYEFVTVYKIIHPGPFDNDPKELETSEFFEIQKIKLWMLDLPADFTQTTIEILRKYFGLGNR